VGRRKAERRRRWKLTGAMGKDAGVEENKIAEAEEHQQITAELRLHWIGVQGECERRSTVVQRHGGGSVVMVDGAGNWMEKELATARVWARGDGEGARGPEKEMISARRSWHRRRAWQPRRSSSKSHAMWRTRGKTAQDR
jgi:hypothetical protein